MDSELRYITKSKKEVTIEDIKNDRVTEEIYAVLDGKIKLVTPEEFKKIIDFIDLIS